MAPLYLRLLHAAMATELLVLVPVIFIILAVGFATGFFQAATQIEDAAFSLGPKLLTMVALGLFGGFGALSLLERFAREMILQAPFLVAQAWN